MDSAVLVINSGSSSMKFSIFASRMPLELLYHGEIDSILEHPVLRIMDTAHQSILKQTLSLKGHESGLRALFDWLQGLSNKLTLSAVGHRVVHGGRYFSEPIQVTEDSLKKMSSLNSLAPLHQPHNLEAIRIIRALYPALPQVACFDTTFHHTQDRLATLFAIPRSLTDQGIIRYGFHGISYEYIASVITDYIGDIGHQRVIVAHLGNGASLCAMYQQKSVATSMGFTALDGLMMGSRCGRIDPGVLLFLSQEKKYSTDKIQHLLYHESGLAGVSGISSDMRELLSNPAPAAQEAVDLFCYRAAQEVGSLIASLQGCDALIFTAGIGENSHSVRSKICARLHWLGIQLNEHANQTHAPIISEKNSLLVGVIPTNEEWMIAKHTCSIAIPTLKEIF